VVGARAPPPQALSCKRADCALIGNVRRSSYASIYVSIWTVGTWFRHADFLCDSRVKIVLSERRVLSSPEDNRLLCSYDIYTIFPHLRATMAALGGPHHQLPRAKLLYLGILVS